MPTITQKISDLKKVGPVIEVTVTPSVNFLQKTGVNLSDAKATKLLAMIDTGASGTVISKGIADKLGINPVGTALVNTPSSENVSCNQFDVQILLPENISFSSIVVIETPLQGQHIQCLIGRDILQKGILIYTGYENSFTLSF
jgi:predicted aspartyl protease